MAEFRTESLNWLDKLEVLRAQPPDATTPELMKALNQGKSQISDLQAIDGCFDLAAVDKVRQAAQSNPSYTLSFRSARALAGLAKAKTTDLPRLAHSALDITLSRRLTTVQIEALVDWLVQGNSLETFKEPEAGKKGKTKADKKTKAQSQPTDKAEDLKPVIELSKKADAEIARNDGQTTYQDELRALLAKGTAEIEEDEDSGKKGKAGKKSKSASDNQFDWFWEMLLGVKFVSQLRSKAKKGTLTNTEKVLVFLYFVVGKPLVWILGNLGKLLKGTLKEFWHWLKHTLGKTFSQIIQWAIPLILICALIWGVGKVYQWVVVTPLHWMESEVKSGFHADSNNESAQSSPVSQPVASTQVLVGQPVVTHSVAKKIERPVAPTITYQPAVSFAPAASPAQTLYDPKILEIEIAAIPPNSIVKDYPFTPDETMPGDLAVSRLQDLTDTDRYTMKLGSGTQKILSLTPTTTNLVLNYKSGDTLGGFLSGGGQLNFFWEDVKYIHINEIDVETQTSSANANGNNGPLAQPNLAPQFVTSAQVYQCSLVVSGSKNPLTIQCARAEDLEHLVSTLEYFIRSSRLAHDAQPAGLPYSFQGLRLTNDGVVDKLWPQSPMDKVGVTLGDHLWSIGKVTSEKQGRNDLEAGLRSLPVTFFAASPVEWNKAVIARDPAQANSFRPRLRKIILPSP